MNDGQLRSILISHYPDALFWAPETLPSRYGILKNDKDKKIIITLHINRDAIKNRIEGKIQDNWLSKETFGKIADDCVSILSKFNLEPWQIQLIDLLRSYTD